MGKLTDAIKLLTDLKVQLVAQTAHATTEITNKNYDPTEILLDKEIQHVNECLNEVQTARASTSRKEKNPKFSILNGLQTEVEALRDGMGVLKTQCAEAKAEIIANAAAAAELQARTEAERQARITAERQARTAAEQQARAATERQARAATERQVKAATERQAQAAVEQQIKAAADLQLRITADRQARLAAERQARAEAETRRHIEAEAKRQEEAEQEARRHAEIEALLQTDVETLPQTAIETLPHVEVEVPQQIEDDIQSTEHNPEIATVLLAEAVPLNEEQAYTRTLQQLKDYKLTPYSKNVDDCLVKLISVVEGLKGKERTSDLIEALEKTYLRVTTSFPPEQYEAIARSMQGKPSTGLKVIGGLMIALAVALAALAVVFAPALLGLAAAVALTGTAATITTAAVATVTSASIAATGIGIFAQGFKQKGISEAMSHLNKAKLAQSKEQLNMQMV